MKKKVVVENRFARIEIRTEEQEIINKIIRTLMESDENRRFFENE